ncbi:hypothetical protein KAR91_70340 [Candidatus Pacearchaeota archaeon]|nr:hypothetical protein [Candidatus Pacearchaeota archaeon]
MSFEIEKDSGYWKYKTRKDHGVFTKITPLESIFTKYIILTSNGELIIKNGYGYNDLGWLPSIKTTMKAMLFHEALYYLVKERLLCPSFRVDADKLLRDICIREGMWKWMAWLIYRIVRLMGENSIK